ncbi:MAG: hypothetical protein NTX67_00710 [Burkholderiales bacterium]|nr:hypothetical protein [Burkholderiales bacterium]
MAVGSQLMKSTWQWMVIGMSISVGLAAAQQAVYKCGQEITNEPADPSLCQKLLISSPTQIEGTRVQNGQPSKPLSAAPVSAVERPVNTSMSTPENLQRNAQARTILEDEWQKLSDRYAEMVRNSNAGQPALMAGETLQNPQYKRRTAEMQVQIERMARDMLALNREMARYAPNLATVKTQ